MQDNREQKGKIVGSHYLSYCVICMKKAQPQRIYINLQLL